MIDDGASAGRSSPLSSATPRRRPPEVLTEAEAVALIRACSARAPTGVRNRADRCLVALRPADL